MGFTWTRHLATIWTYSSVKGFIFCSGSSSSANSFVYLSQFFPVALGIVTMNEQCPKAWISKFEGPLSLGKSDAQERWLVARDYQAIDRIAIRLSTV